MLRSINEMRGYKLSARDGEIGNVQDFYFEDDTARVRYLVVSTGQWLLGKKVLLSPVVIKEPDWATRTLCVYATREQIENAPEIDTSKPVSRDMESKLFLHYGWPVYWTFPPSRHLHLRSAKEVTGYHIKASDGDIGHVEDFIVGDDVWIIRYIVIGTRNWLPGKRVIMSPAWVDQVDWFKREVTIDLPQEVIKEAPEYDPAAPINREHEERMYDYYGRPRYWA